jgi:hypothetical protein
LMPTVLAKLEENNERLVKIKTCRQSVFWVQALHVLQKSQFADERWQWAGQAVSPEVPATIPETNNVNYPIHLAMSLGDLELYIKLVRYWSTENQ